MQEAVLPALGVAMSEGLLIRWLKEPGDAVERGEPIAEIETDKATMEVESPATGHLGPHLYEPGASVPPGSVIAKIIEAGDGVPEGEAEAAVTADVRPKGVGGSGPLGPATTPLIPDAGVKPPHALSPRARREARERATAEAARGGEERPRRQSGKYRVLIAERVTKAWHTIPHFAVTREIDAEFMLRALAQHRSQGRTLTLTDLLLRALGAALKSTVASPSSDLGLAVATDEGVVTPVLVRAAELGLDNLAVERRRAVERARSGRLNHDDLSLSPASTLSNLGSYGVDQFTGVIATGQVSLLTVGRVRPRAVADSTAVAVRQTFFATLNVDHRALDGADAARLLDAFATALQNPHAMEISDG